MNGLAYPPSWLQIAARAQLALGCQLSLSGFNIKFTVEGWGHIKIKGEREEKER